MPVMDASSSLERTSLMSVYCRWGHAAFGKERKKISGPRTTESVPSLCSSYGTQNSSSIMMLNLPKLIKEAEESDKKTRKGCTRSRNEL